MPDSLADLVVTSAKVTMKCAANGTLTAETVATVKNQSPTGTADLSKITWNILLEATWGYDKGADNLETPSVKPVNPQVGGPKALKPGESWTATLVSTGIPHRRQGGQKGVYVFRVVADPLGGVAESNEKNNATLAYASDPCTP